MNKHTSRRDFIRQAGIGSLGFWAGGALLHMSPAEARDRQLPFHVLTTTQLNALEAFADTLLPGSADAGVAHFIDHQLAAQPGDQLLMIRYLGVEAPFTPFYTAGLAALDNSAQQAHGGTFAGLNEDQRRQLTGQIAQANPEGWVGPPAPLFYFVLRSDALDVVYGTQAGVESLGLPYMAHIEPPSRWGES